MKLHLALLNLILIAVTCVHAVPISHEEIIDKSARGLRLLQLSEDSDPVWKTEKETLDLISSGKKFFDVTETWEIYQELEKARINEPLAPAATFAPPSHQSAVNPLLSQVSTSNMQSYLSSLTAFNNRYYQSQTGAAASTWIFNTVKSIAGSRSDISVSLFTHSWTESSIIVKIAGGSASSPVTILGAHMDSINLSNPSSGRAPGADDDGTGSVNLIEAFRVLVTNNFKPSTPLEFHWYSAEEVGLLGSQAIATSYKKAGVAVKAFMQLDMTGYFKPGSREVMALEADFIDSGLNTFLGQLIDTYSRLPWTMDIPCGYACSDHASWNRQGYPSAFPFEAVTGNDDPVIHSSSDTTSVSGFSWSHSLEFAKIAVAFAYELTV